MLKPDVLLVYPPVMRKHPASDPPFGLMYIAAVLQNAGIRVEILDLNVKRLSDEEVKSYFEENSFPIVGFGGMTTVYYYVKWLAAHIKATHPDTKLIGGGSFATPCPELVLRHTDLDAVCVGEGEGSIVPLVERLIGKKSLDGLRGIVWKQPSGAVSVNEPPSRMENLDALPFPAYDLVDMKYYLQATGLRPSLQRLLAKNNIALSTVSNYFIMFSQRGCPFNCSFCYRNFGRQVVNHSVDYVIEHIRHVRDKFGVNNIAFYDETFNAKRQWVTDFCNRVKQEMPGTYFWMGGARADLLDEDMVRLLHDACFYEVSIGVESFDDRILKEMGKHLTAGQLIETIKLLQKYDLAPSYAGMLYGFPGDDEASLERSVAAITDLGLNAYFQFPLPFPGTRLYQELLAAGRIEDEEQFMLSMADQMTQDLFINLSRFPDKQLVDMVRDAEKRITEKRAAADNDDHLMGRLVAWLKRKY